MRKSFLFGTALTCGSALFAQNPAAETKSIFDKLFRSDASSDKFKVYLHTKGSLNTNVTDGEIDKLGFRMDQLRIDIKGDLNNRIYYRLQQRLTTPNTSSSTDDNLPVEIDYAGLGYRFTDKFRMFAGKMCTAYGGFEFDDNPINVYQYSLIHENMLAFLTGIDLAYDLNEKHELRLQMLGARNYSMDKTYHTLPLGTEPSIGDFVYTLNWNGNFGENNIISTRWSASFLNETKDHNMYYGVLGTALNLPKFGMFLDLMYSREELDRKQMITNMNSEGEYNQTDVDYSSVILGMNYRVAPKVNVFAKGIWDTGSKYKTSEGLEKGKYFDALGYSAGIEYQPVKSENLKFALAYTGRKYLYTDLGKKLSNLSSNENKIEISFIYCMNLF